MKRLGVGIITVAVALVSMVGTAIAQSRTISSEMRTETATVEAIEAASRTITLKKPDGTFVSVVAGPEVKRFAEIKVGQVVTSRYYENVVVRLQPTGSDVVSAARSTTSSEQVLPGGTKAKQVNITATITATDMSIPSITFSGPNGWKYTSRVQDKEALAKVKVGDKVAITWTEAMLVSVEPGK